MILQTAADACGVGEALLVVSLTDEQLGREVFVVGVPDDERTSKFPPTLEPPGIFVFRNVRTLDGEKIEAIFIENL